MNTVSSKSTLKKKPQPGTSPRGRTENRVLEDSRAPDISTGTWFIASATIFFVAVILRLYNLALVPLHHDEGVNGNFLVQLVRDNFYHYNPENYHGPSLYYFAAVIPWTTRLIFGASAQNAYGLTTTNIRLVPALFGLGTIWLILMLRRQLGSIAVLAAAALVAISPGAVYLSRYFIHESLFVFFTLGIVVAGLKYYEEGQPVHLILAAASAALLFATKETSIISFGVLLIALVSTHLYRWFWRAFLDGTRSGVDSPASFYYWSQDTLERLGGPANIAIWLLVAIATFVVIAVLFYSSFFTYSQGIADSLKTFQVWSKTGQTAHVHAWWYYIAKWLVYQESAVLVLGIIGACRVIWRPKNTLALFSAFWAFGIIAAYSLVPYKTPWLMLNFIVPLAIISGYALQWAFQQLREHGVSRITTVIATLVVWALIAGGPPNWLLTVQSRPINWKAMIPGYQTLDLNFLNYDNDDDYYVYVYAHTKRDMLRLLDEIERIARQSGAGKDLGITIVSPDYWPLPWYFRDYQRVGYFGHMSQTTEPIIIASEGQRAEVQATFSDRYRQVDSSFALRPGVDLLLWVRRDVGGPVTALAR